MKQFSWGAIFRGAIFLGGIFPWGIFPGGNFLGGFISGGNFPRGNFLGGIFPGGIFPRGIFPDTASQMYTWQLRDLIHVLKWIVITLTLLSAGDMLLRNPPRHTEQPVAWGVTSSKDEYAIHFLDISQYFVKCKNDINYFSNLCFLIFKQRYKGNNLNYLGPGIHERSQILNQTSSWKRSMCDLSVGTRH